MNKKCWESSEARKCAHKGTVGPEAEITGKAYDSFGMYERGVSRDDFMQDPASYLRRLSMGRLSKKATDPSKGCNASEES